MSNSTLEERITEYVTENPGSKGREIANALGEDKTAVNSYLYRHKNKTFRINNERCWFPLRRRSLDPEPQKPEEAERNSPPSSENVSHGESDVSQPSGGGFAYNSLESLRNKLLDLTGRNSLLNYRHPKASSLRIVDELPDQVAEILASGKKLFFEPVPEPTEKQLIEHGYIKIDPETGEKIVEKYPDAKEWATKIGIHSQYELPAAQVAGDAQPKHTDNKLQTLLYAPQLEGRLRNIRRKSELSLEESGANILYIALGFLEWIEQRDSEVKRLAPVFTIPVKLERGNIDRERGVYRYSIEMKDDGLLTNITLREKLAGDFDLVLPEIVDDDEQITPELYYQLIDKTILKQKPTWKLHRFASLVLLNFSKQVMYEDLAPDSWPDENQIESNEIIKGFFSSIKSNDGVSEGISYLEEYRIDELGDVHQNYPLIYDADSSQHSALVDALNNNNIVIEGPPGTGKSQTITNLIAASIVNGKKVLFVAEKMAALNVVKRRLDLAGLGDFCLELHSHKTNKIKILQDLNTRINRQQEFQAPRNLQAEISRYESLKEDLSKYAKEVNAEWKETGLTIHEILHKATMLRETTKLNPESIKVDNISGDTLNALSLKELVDRAQILKNIYNHVSEQSPEGAIASHYWFGVTNHKLAGFDFKNLNDALADWTESLNSLLAVFEEHANALHVGEFLNSNLDTVREINGSLSEIPNVINASLLENIEYSLSHQDEFDRFIGNYKRIHKEYSAAKSYINLAQAFEADFSSRLKGNIDNLTGLAIDESQRLSDLKSQIDLFTELETLIVSLSNTYAEIKASLPGGLKGCFELSDVGIAELEKLNEAIVGLPKDLWRYRDEIYDNPDIDPVLEELTSKLNSILPSHQSLIDVFSTHRLPNSEDINQSKLILEEGGFFRIFNSDWRAAKKAMLGLTIRPKTKLRDVLPLLDDLVAYKQGLESIEKLNSEYPDLKNISRGVETPIDRINSIRNWYKSIRDEYGVGFGSRVQIGQELIGLDSQLAFSLSSAFEKVIHKQTSRLSEIVSILKVKYRNINVLREKECSYSEGLREVQDSARLIKSAASYFDEHILNQNIDIRGLGVLYNKVFELENLRDSWQSDDVYSVIVSDDFPLSIDIDDFSKELLSDAEKYSGLLSIANSCPLIKQALVSQPSEERYQQLVVFGGAFNHQYSSAEEKLINFKRIGSVNTEQWIDGETSNLKSLIERNNLALSNPEWLSTWVDYLSLTKKLTANGLSNLILALESNKIESEQLVEALELSIYSQLSDEIMIQNTLVRDFNGIEQMAVRDKFQEYDRKLMSLQRRQIAANAAKNKTEEGNSSGRVSTHTEISLIKREVNKKTRHVAVRSLLQRAKKSILALKPCFMMSPMSVAQYLKPGDYTFDLVVMDEASQIKPEDALGVIARGNNLVVVGDPKQLPPTNFFNKVAEVEDEDELIGLEDSESILESVIPLFKNRRLRWHYRSRHESLIAFSNKNFYDSNLVIFPSPFQENDEFGIKFNRCAKGRFYQNRNVEEAREVVSAIAAHYLSNPNNESLGVVCMNSHQQAEIELQLEQLLKDDFTLSTAIDNQSTKEPLFIKNLENVQGDERDVIIISMTYGPESIGGRTMQRFGPINRSDGWRRLNVLFTRSKKRMIVYSSMGSSDILVDETSSKGKTSLRNFLEYCETGHLNHAIHTGKEPDSDFEVAVINMLYEHGYTCEPQLGVAGYFIDLAVRDPGDPGRFLMAIECDGATYHSAKSARDRDRLRQEVLENLGWNVKRIWSTDWFKNPAAQLQPIIRELDELKTPITANPIAEEKCSEIAAAEEIADSDIDNTLNAESVSLRDCLEDLDKHILSIYPNTNPDQRLLRPAMLEALLNYKPCSKAEFLESIPGYIRQGTSVDEAKYLEEVLEIIADYG